MLLNELSALICLNGLSFHWLPKCLLTHLLNCERTHTHIKIAEDDANEKAVICGENHCKNVKKKPDDLKAWGQLYNDASNKKPEEQQKAQAACVDHRLLIIPGARFMSGAWVSSRTMHLHAGAVGRGLRTVDHVHPLFSFRARSTEADLTTCEVNLPLHCSLSLFNPGLVILYDRCVNTNYIRSCKCLNHISSSCRFLRRRKNFKWTTQRKVQKWFLISQCTLIIIISCEKNLCLLQWHHIMLTGKSGFNTWLPARAGNSLPFCRQITKKQCERWPRSGLLWDQEPCLQHCLFN